MQSPVAKPTSTATDVVQLVEMLSDFTRFMVRLPHSKGRSLSELGVLRALTRRGPLRISDLAADQDLTQPGMTQLVTRLEHAGLVARRGDPSDGRVVLVALTAAGQCLSAEREANRVALFHELYDELEERERARLREALPVLSRLMAIKEARADVQP